MLTVDSIRGYVANHKTLSFAAVGGLGAFIGSLIGQIGNTSGLARVSLWDACIGLGIGAALSWLQSLYLRRTQVATKDVVRTAIRCALGGAAGGAALILTKMGFGHGMLSHIAAWTAEGLIMGWLLAPVFPNLKRTFAIIAGGVAGAAGAVLGTMLGPIFGAMLGAAVADALKGLALGIGLTLTEKAQISRGRSIIIDWGSNQTSTLLVGATPIRFGSDSSCQVYIAKSNPASPAVVAEVMLVGSEVRLNDKRSGANRVLREGERVDFEDLTIEVVGQAPIGRR